MKCEITATIDFNAESAKRRLHLEPGGAVQMAIDKAVMDYAQPFIPAGSASMPLAKSCYRATIAGSGLVEWPGPYAHFQYVGYVRTTDDGRVFARKGESKPKLTNRPLKYTKDVNPLAGPRWIEPMKGAYMDKILHEAQAAMKGGG